jgi:aquaporin Z
MTAAHIDARAPAARAHWREYVIEAALLGSFMVSACVVTALLEHPGSAANAILPDPLTRRALIGLAMGATAIVLIYSPWGRRSGAHFNPSVTLTYLRLGKIERHDALGYVFAQCAGGALGVLLGSLLLGDRAGHPAVAYAATLPGAAGPAVAFAAELTISFLLMSVVLRLSNGEHARLTGLACGALVAAYITFEAPLSGMSMNPARSLASALFDGRFSELWIYLVAPPLGMLAAAELYRFRGLGRVLCAKLHHDAALPCIFRCGHAALEEV